MKSDYHKMHLICDFSPILLRLDCCDTYELFVPINGQKHFLFRLCVFTRLYFSTYCFVTIFLQLCFLASPIFSIYIRITSNSLLTCLLLFKLIDESLVILTNAPIHSTISSTVLRMGTPPEINIVQYLISYLNPISPWLSLNLLPQCNHLLQEQLFLWASLLIRSCRL